MSFPVEESCAKVTNDELENVQIGCRNDIANNFNNTHNSLSTSDKDAATAASPQQPHDIINSNQIDDTKNLPPGSSITRSGESSTF